MSDEVERRDDEEEADPVFKGMLRTPSKMGVPYFPLAIAGSAVLCFGTATFLAYGLLAGIAGWMLAIPVWAGMATLSRTDDLIFNSIWLWAKTRLINRFRINFKLWGGSAYSIRVNKRRGDF